MLQYLPRTDFDYPDEVLLTENGSYMNKCCSCENLFHGPKRAPVCFPCKVRGEKEWAALTPEQQHERTMEFAKIANEVFEKHRLEREKNG